MSLDELLKDSRDSSSWSAQKKKLFRIVLGVSIVALALVVAGFMLLSAKEKKLEQKEALRAQQEVEADALASLIRLRQETASLEEQIDSLKSARESANVARRGPASPNQSTSTVPSATGTVAEIISFDPGEGFTSVSTPEGEAYIPTGSVFQGRLITPIKTSVERTFVMAETTHEFRMDMKRRIPSGSRLIGRSRLNPILKGVIVEFDTLILPNGIETALSGLALSRNALPEIDGLYFSDDLQNYGTALAFGFLSGFADASRERELTFFGTQPEQTMSNKVLAGLSTASFQVAEEILRDIRNRAIEYVVVPAGEPVFIALTQRYNVTQGSATRSPR